MKRSTKKVLVYVSVFIGLLVIVAASLYFGGVLQNVSPTTEKYVSYSTKLFGTYECLASPGGPKLGETKAPGTSVKSGQSTFYTFSCPKNTDKCDLIISATDKPSVFTARILSYVRSGEAKTLTFNSALNGYPTARITNVGKDEVIGINYASVSLLDTKELTAFTVTSYYTPFVIYRKSVCQSTKAYNPEQGCQLTEDDYNKVVISDSTGQAKEFTMTEINTGGIINFVDCAVSIPKPNTINYKGQEGQCIDGKIYGFETVDTPSTTYKYVNFNDIIGTEDCCPETANPAFGICGNDFKWQAVQNADCQSTDVIPARPTDQNSLVEFNCKDGKWISKVTPVECTKNTDCGNTQACLPDVWKCQDLAAPQGGGDTVISKQQKCEESSFLGIKGEWRDKSTTTCGLFCKIGLSEPTTTSEPYCYKPYWIILSIIGGVFAVLIVLILVLTKKPSKKGVK
jgi:hypothetical protein